MDMVEKMARAMAKASASRALDGDRLSTAEYAVLLEERTERAWPAFKPDAEACIPVLRGTALDIGR